MKNSFIAILIAGAIALASCNSLDKIQDGKLSVSNMWKTEVQVEGSTYGIFQQMRSNFIQDQVNMFFWGELRVGEYMWGPSPWYNVWVGRDVITNTMSATSTSANWSKLYTAIDQANAVLKYAPDQSIAMSDAKRSWAIGQASFARAYCYFWAARIWGDVPLNLKPIESTTQPECYPSRTAKAEVYAQIGKDIDTAIENEANLGTDKYNATKTAVRMLQAEWALWMYATQGKDSKYLDIADTALKAIGISSSLLCDDYGDIFDRMKDSAKESKNSKEVVFALFNSQKEQKTGGYSRYFTFPSGDIAQAFWTKVPLMETQWLNFGSEFVEVLRDSRDNKGDTRVKYNFGDGNYGTDGSNKYWCNKYTGQMDGSTKSIRDCDIVYYRTALAVMMDAELKYYQGNYDKALASLNIIAKRAYGKSNYYLDATQKGVLDALTNEYFLEFPAEGVIWWALIRLDKIWDYNSYLKEQKASNPNILLWPITKSARDKNSNLTQTEGWY